MTKHGVEIWLDGRWLFVEAIEAYDSPPPREYAVTLQRISQKHLPSRLVIKTEEGFIVPVHATE